MNNLKWSLVAVGVALLGAVAGYRWALRDAPAAHDAGAMPAAASSAAAATTDGGRRILYWRDPMKPDVRFDKPGKSPFMDMELMPDYADEDSGAIDAGIRDRHAAPARTWASAPAVSREAAIAAPLSRRSVSWPTTSMRWRWWRRASRATSRD